MIGSFYYDADHELCFAFSDAGTNYEFISNDTFSVRTIL